VERRPPSRFSIRRWGRAPVAAGLVLAVMLIPALVARAAVDDTAPVSVATGGTPADGHSGPGIVVSSSGRHVVFESAADNLSDADDDSVVNIYVRDRETGETSLVSRATGASGAGADADSHNPAISPDGRYVAFESRATNLSDSDLDLPMDVFVRDLQGGATTLVSRAPDGSAANEDSGDPSIAEQGTVVAFESRATNLSDLDHDAHMDVFLHNGAADTTRLVSRAASGAPADGSSYDPSIASNGRRVAFASDADNLFLDDRDIYTNVYVAVVEPAFTLLTHVSRTPASGSETHPANGNSTQPAISADGAHVAFVSAATNLAGGVGIEQVFVRNLSANSTELVSRGHGTTGAMAATAASSPSISSDGRLVAFASAANTLGQNGESGVLADKDRRPPVLGSDVFVRDTSWGDTILMSRLSGAAGGPLERDSFAPALAPGGTLIAFVLDVKVGEEPPTEQQPQPTDILRSTILARELAWRAPRPPDQLPEGGHHGGGDGHTDGHVDAGHGDGGHGAGTAAHGHGAGGAHFTLRLGGVGADRLFGTPLHDKLCGGGGNDVISLSGGPDVGYGGACGALEPPTVTKSGWWRTVPGVWRHAGDKDAAPKTGPGVNDNDRLIGGKGDDALFGGPGSDRLVGGSGADYLSGGSGHDRLVGGPGRNRIEAGGGSDSVNSANGVRELVDCGFGRDTVTADRRDRLSGCERVKRVRRTGKKDPLELLPECPGGGHECHKDDGGTVVLRGARHAG
jgi:Tol biopolymer transport system component